MLQLPSRWGWAFVLKRPFTTAESEPFLRHKKFIATQRVGNTVSEFFAFGLDLATEREGSPNSTHVLLLLYVRCCW
jgi:hypothetical protein